MRDSAGLAPNFADPHGTRLSLRAGAYYSVDGGWWMVDGGWWMVDGGWWMVDGGWWSVVRTNLSA